MVPDIDVNDDGDSEQSEAASEPDASGDAAADAPQTPTPAPPSPVPLPPAPPPEAVPCSLENALELTTTNIFEICNVLGLEIHSAQWHVVLRPERRPDYEHLRLRLRVWRLGSIRPFGHVLKCTCALHKGCTLLLNCPGSFVEAEAVLIKWLCGGVGMSAIEHAVSRVRANSLFAARAT